MSLLRTSATVLAAALAAIVVSGCSSTEPQTAEAVEEPAVAAEEVVAEEPVDVEAQMAEYARVGQPSEHHERMARIAGNWDVVGKMWMDPAQPPMDVTAAATFTVELGGRWVRQVYESNFMGQPFRGIGMDGYDNARGKHIGYWFDSMSTGCFALEGTYDPATRTLTSEGSMFDPVTRSTEYARMTITDRSDDEFVAMMYKLVEGADPIPMMELVYTRRK